MELWARLRSDVEPLGATALAAELFAVARGEAGSRLAIELAWIAYRLCPELSPVATVHVPVAIAALHQAAIGPADFVIEIEAVCAEHDVADALATSDDVLVAEIAEAVARPRFRHRTGVVEAVAAATAGEPASAAELPAEPALIAHPDIEAARQAIRDRNPAGASALCEAVLARGERELVESAAIVGAIGQTKLGDYLAAVRVLERGIALRETAWQQLLRGTYLNNLKRNDEAAVALRRALALPDGLGFVLTDAYNELAYAAMQRDQLATCERAATLSLLHDRAASGSRRLRIGARLALANLAGATRDAEVLVEIDPIHGYALRAHCRLVAGDLAGAIEDERRYREFHETHPQAVLASALWRQGNAREALRDLDVAMPRHPKPWTLRLVRARVRAELGELEGALDDLAFAITHWDEGAGDTMHGCRPIATRAEAVAIRAEFAARYFSTHWPDTSAALASARSYALTGDVYAAIRCVLDVLRDGDREARAAARARLPLLFRVAAQGSELDQLRREATILT